MQLNIFEIRHETKYRTNIDREVILNQRSNIYDMWLSHIERLGAKRILKLAKTSGLNEDLGDYLYHSTSKEMESFLIKYFGDKQSTYMLADLLVNAHKSVPEAISETLWKKGIHYISYYDPDYPEKLRHIPDPPFQLYYFGSLPDKNTACVAVVGSRTPSIYGKEQARRFSVSLASSGVQIISGLARGIDGIAGMGCLDAGGMSFAVLGGGVDVCYPPENRDLYDALKAHGGVISEYNPGLMPQNRFFPPRNRIISGFSDAVLVVEAKERSGSLITVDRALEQGRDVFAIPGRNGDRTSSGCNNLIRQGAGIAIEPEDILQTLPGYSQFTAEETGQLRFSGADPGMKNSSSDVVKDKTNENPRSSEADMNTDNSSSDNKKSRRNQTSPGRKIQELRVARAKAAGESRYNKNMELIYSPAYENPRPESLNLEERNVLPRIDREILSVLDRSTPYDLEIIATALSDRMKKQIDSAELIREITYLILKGFVQEVRIGYYVRS